jgi:D-cysteine desulfhydrase family pyridoxal phosphate-dependent enzyme
MHTKPDFPAAFGRIAAIPRQQLLPGRTALEPMPNLGKHCGNARLLVKRDDCTGLAFGGNKVRQIEFYLGAASAQDADTLLITGSVQSNFVRTAAAGARKMGMTCHIQLEERVATSEPHYHDSGNVLIDKLLGATLYSYPDGEDESGADRQLAEIAADLRNAGRRPYVIPLAPGHPPLGALGYVLAAQELLHQITEGDLQVNEIIVGSGSGATHGGLLFGLRALGSAIEVTGVCVRRDAALQRIRVRDTCDGIAALLDVASKVSDDDIRLTDAFLAPGYGKLNPATSRAIVLGAQTEGLMLDPVYSGKAMAGTIQRAKSAADKSTLIFLHTGGTPAIFAYQDAIEESLASFAAGQLA